MKMLLPLFLLALYPAFSFSEPVDSVQHSYALSAQARPGFIEAEMPQLGGLVVGEALGIVSGTLLGVLIGPVFSTPCKSDDETCHSSWISPEGGAAIFGGFVGALLGQAIGIHLSGHLMNKKGYVMLTILETAAWDAAAFFGSRALYESLDPSSGSDDAAVKTSLITFIGTASLMPCLTYAWLDYRISFPVVPRLTLNTDPNGTIHPGLRMDIIQARFH